MKLILVLILCLAAAACVQPPTDHTEALAWLLDDGGVPVAPDDPEVAMAARALDDWMGGKANGPDLVCVKWYAQTCCSQGGSYCCCYFFSCHCATP